MSFKISTSNILDNKRCYELWISRVSIYEIPKILEREGIINSKKGRKVTPQGVWRAAWLWALDNLDVAKKDQISLYDQEGKVFDFEVWRREIVAKARQFYSSKHYRKFLEIHPEYAPK